MVAERYAHSFSIGDALFLCVFGEVELTGNTFESIFEHLDL